MGWGRGRDNNIEVVRGGAEETALQLPAVGSRGAESRPWTHIISQVMKILASLVKTHPLTHKGRKKRADHKTILSVPKTFK